MADYLALLLMVIVLVISEEAVPFTRYIYHVDDQASQLLFCLPACPPASHPLCSCVLKPYLNSNLTTNGVL